MEVCQQNIIYRNCEPGDKSHKKMWDMNVERDRSMTSGLRMWLVYELDNESAAEMANEWGLKRARLWGVWSQ